MRRLSLWLCLALAGFESCNCGGAVGVGGSGGGGASVTGGGDGASDGGTTGGGAGGGGVSDGGATGGGGVSDGGATGGGVADGGGVDAGPGCTAAQFFINGACAPLTVCTAAQFETAAPTATSDRQCAALTVCTATEYETHAPTATSDRQCAALTVCTATEFETHAPTGKSDRQCAALTVCTAAQYEAAPPSATSDRSCQAISTCTAAQYEVSAPSATADRVCAALTACTVDQYQTAAPTATSDRVCTPLTVCFFTEYQTVAPTATSDRVCAPLTVCTVAQCETVAPTATSDRQCGPLSLDLSPATAQTVTVTPGQAPPTVAFTASACGSAVSAAWTLDVGAIATINGGPANVGTVTPTGAVGGVVTVIAGYQGHTASRKVLVKLSGTQNGYTSASAEQPQVVSDAGVLLRGGGVGGVGGEGLGPAVSGAALAGLQTPTGTGQAPKLLYPYDATVWPRGMAAPLLQWDWSVGDPDGVRIDLATTTGSFTWSGTFGRPAVLAATGGKFQRHPIPQDVWDMATTTAGGPTLSGQTDKLSVSLYLVKAGVAYGPSTQTWVIAPARLTGTIYYQSYGTLLANNYTGAQGTPTSFGAAVLSIRAGDTAPQLVTSATNCQVCHSVAAKGARLQTQASTNKDKDSWQYTLTPTGATGSQLSKNVVLPAYPGLSPDGTFMLTPNGLLQSLPDNSGANLPISGLSTVTTNVGVPAFSPDGKRVVFNPQNTVSHPGRELVVMDFERDGGVFSNPAVVVDDALTSTNVDVRPAWPQFFPDSNSLIFQHQLRVSADGNSADTHTRKFAQGQLYWSSAVASASPQPLHALNGYDATGLTSYLPKLSTGVTLSCTADSTNVGSNAGTDGDDTHALDANYNYEPTVNPVSSGGYAWVVFTSRRMYGNVATIPPFCSDPRGVDLHVNVTPKKLWVAAIDLNAAPGTDPSHPAFYLPAQELLAGNARGFWVLDPCRSDDASCATGDQCCNGFCEPNGAGGALVCSTRPPNYVCSGLQEACSVDGDCCDTTASCVGGFCASNR
jgi:hypothetical protein